MLLRITISYASPHTLNSVTPGVHAVQARLQRTGHMQSAGLTKAGEKLEQPSKQSLIHPKGQDVASSYPLTGFKGGHGEVLQSSSQSRKCGICQSSADRENLERHRKIEHWPLRYRA